MKIHMIEQRKRAKAVMMANAARTSQNENISNAYKEDTEVVKNRSESLKVINEVEPPPEVRDEFDDTMCSTKPLENVHETRVQSGEESDGSDMEEMREDQFVNICTELSNMEQEKEVQSEEESYESEMEKIREDHIETLRKEHSVIEQEKGVQSEEESDGNEMEETSEGQFARLCAELSRMEEEGPKSPPDSTRTTPLVSPQPNAQTHLTLEVPISTSVSPRPNQSILANSYSTIQEATSEELSIPTVIPRAFPSTPTITPVSKTSTAPQVSTQTSTLQHSSPPSSQPSNQQTSMPSKFVCKKCHKTFFTQLRHKNHSLKCGLAAGQTVKLEPGLRKVMSLKPKKTR